MFPSVGVIGLLLLSIALRRIYGMVRYLFITDTRLRFSLKKTLKFIQLASSHPAATYHEKGPWSTIAAQCLISSCMIARLAHGQVRNHNAEEYESR